MANLHHRKANLTKAPVPAVIRPIRQGEEASVCEMIRRSFDAYVGCDYSLEGVAEFYKYADPVAMADRLSSDHFVLVAEENREVVGMIELRGNEHIALLFVDPPYLRKGISRLLFEQAMRIVRRDNPSFVKITVNSSRYAVPVYRALGFEASGPEQTISGITFVPMTLEINRGV